MKKPLSLLFFLLLIVPVAVQAQTNMQLKFVRDLPKNLFSARTAVLIGYTSNVETTPEEDARIISKFSTQLLTDNQNLGLQLLHFADKNVLLQPAKKNALLRQYDSLKIENLLLLDITDIKGAGAVGSYVLTHTAFNRRVTLTSPNQKAFVLQAETYEKLIRNFVQATKQYGPNYFEEGPAVKALKPVLAAEPNPQTLPASDQTAAKKTVKPVAYPLITRTAEDMQRGNGGPTRNFYYYLAADQRERNAGFFGQHLRQDIAASPDALKELDKYRNYKIGYLAERAVFVSSVILYANEVLQDEGYVYFNDRQKVYLGIAAGSLLVNVLILRNTNQHMLRAIDEYNAFATVKNNSSFHKFKPSGFGFGTFYNRNVVPGLTLNWQLR